jgi:hypothetical protein
MDPDKKREKSQTKTEKVMKNLIKVIKKVIEIGKKVYIFVTDLIKIINSNDKTNGKVNSRNSRGCKR